MASDLDEAHQQTQYIADRTKADKKDIVRKLKKESKSAEMVWLASDEDREGEPER